MDLWVVLLSCICVFSNHCCSLVDDDFGFTTTKAPKTAEVRRENNLDHWDSDTLAYYLDEYPGYDLAVMFYAPWDEYSHKLAPYWNQIAHILDAGTTQSKLIMSLFDCELNSAHMQLCQTISITHYPTLLFIGSGPLYDSDPITRLLFGKKRSVGMMGESPVLNTIKFQGNWQIPDSILDWIKTMQALSRWHLWSTKGFGRKLRNIFFREKVRNEQLPLGVPNNRRLRSSSASDDASSSFSSSVKGDRFEELETTISKWKNATYDMKKVALRTATFLESVLLESDGVADDIFTLLDKQDAWKDMKSSTSLYDVYRFCALEQALDYCQRVADGTGTKVVDRLVASNLTKDELLEASDNLTLIILEELTQYEPYCGIIDKCVQDNMDDESCRPKQCPFTNKNACRYVAACMDPTVIADYAEALDLDVDSLLVSSETTNTETMNTLKKSTPTKTETKKKGWGF